MLITAMIWGSTFLAQNIATRYMGALTFSGLRFLAGSLSLSIILYFYLKKQNLTLTDIFPKKIFSAGVLLGTILTVGINLQQVGIAYTSITNSGFITGLYVILVPIIGLFLKQKTTIATWFGAFLALMGMGLLTITDNLSINFGDLIILISAFAWAFHVIMVSSLMSRYNPLAIAVIQCIACATLSLLLAITLEDLTISFNTTSIFTILCTGIISVAISFTLQLIAQKDAVASHAAIILSLESVFAAICGAIFLHEMLSIRGYLGCLLMFIGVIIAQIGQIPKDKVLIEP